MGQGFSFYALGAAGAISSLSLPLPIKLNCDYNL